MKDKKIIIIGATRYVEGVERWMKTIIDTQPDYVQPVLIKYAPWPKKNKIPKEFKVYDIEGEGYPGNDKRHKDVWRVIKDYGEDKWYVWSDTIDVIFQQPLPTLDDYKEYDIITAPEKTLHKHNGYWQARMSDEEKRILADESIRNAGLFIIKGSVYLKFVKYLTEYNYIPNDDQACYNRWLVTQKIKELITDSLHCMGGLTGSEATFVGGKYVCKSNNKPYIIVHANGDTKPILNNTHSIKDYIEEDENARPDI